MPMTLKETIANIDPRLRGQTIRFTGDGVLVMVDGNWHTLDHDFSVRIELAPQFMGYVGAAVAGANYPCAAEPPFAMTNEAMASRNGKRLG